MIARPEHDIAIVHKPGNLPHPENQRRVVRCTIQIALKHGLRGPHLSDVVSRATLLILTVTTTGSDVSELSRDAELWAMALWVEKHHGENGWFHIAQQQDRLLEAGDRNGVALWNLVGERFETLTTGSSSPN